MRPKRKFAENVWKKTKNELWYSVSESKEKKMSIETYDTIHI